jgi:hypothetical protein
VKGKRRYYIVVGLVVAVVVGLIYLSYQTVPIRWNSRHPGISIKRPESWWVNVYTSLLLGTGRKVYRSEQPESSAKLVRPQVIGVILSDKTRFDNQQEVGGVTRYSSTMSDVNETDLLLYVYVSPEALTAPQAEREIVRYVIDSLEFYKVGAKAREWRWPYLGGGGVLDVAGN